MTLYDKIIAIYPELVNFDFSKNVIFLENSGDGDYIAKWEHPTLVKPTIEQLA
jgi:hypothetical protein